MIDDRNINEKIILGSNKQDNVVNTNAYEYPRLEIKHVSKKFQNALNKNGFITAVNDVSFIFEPGKIHGLIGQNGAGKSTLLKAIAGILNPEMGEVILSLSEKQLKKRKTINLLKNERELLKYLRYCPQKPVFYSLLTVEENLTFIGKLYDIEKEKLRDTINQYLEKFELSEKRKTLAQNLSGGQQQRLNLIISLLSPSLIYLFDEPTTGLDLQGKRLFGQILNELREQGKIILISTHDFSEAEELCDYIIFMNEGQIIVHGTFNDLMQNSIKKLIFPIKMKRISEDVLNWDSKYITTLKYSGAQPKQTELENLIEILEKEFKDLFLKIKKQEIKDRNVLKLIFFLHSSNLNKFDIFNEQGTIYKVNKLIQSTDWKILEMELKKKSLKDVYEIFVSTLDD